MAFKIYFNKKTRHPSISLSGKEKKMMANCNRLITPFKDLTSSSANIKQYVYGFVKQKDDSVDRHYRLMGTGGQAP